MRKEKKTPFNGIFIPFPAVFGAGKDMRCPGRLGVPEGVPGFRGAGVPRRACRGSVGIAWLLGGRPPSEEGFRSPVALNVHPMWMRLKEVIRPQVPLRTPCYNLAPLAEQRIVISLSV